MPMGEKNDSIPMLNGVRLRFFFSLSLEFESKQKKISFNLNDTIRVDIVQYSLVKENASTTSKIFFFVLLKHEKHCLFFPLDYHVEQKKRKRK